MTGCHRRSGNLPKTLERLALARTRLGILECDAECLGACGKGRLTGLDQLTPLTASARRHAWGMIAMTDYTIPPDNTSPIVLHAGDLLRVENHGTSHNVTVNDGSREEVAQGGPRSSPRSTTVSNVLQAAQPISRRSTAAIYSSTTRPPITPSSTAMAAISASATDQSQRTL